MHRFLVLGFSLFLNIEAMASDCKFEVFTPTQTDNGQTLYQINATTSLLVEGADNENHLHEGSAWIVTQGQKKCEIKGGNFSGFFIDQSKKVILTEEYSGSCGNNQVINIKNCKPIGKPANFCGGSQLRDGRLVNEPPCESLSNDGKLASCSVGHVWLVSRTNCELKFDKKASAALTQSKLGLKLPSAERAYKVRNIGTPQATIVEDAKK